MPAETSQPQYEVRVVRHVRIPMSDGVQLAAHMFMPDAPGTFPAVFDYYPYRKDDLSPPWRYHHYLAQRGFVALRLDVRGSGGSGGIAVDEYSRQEQLDAVEAIAWMAEQPWCNGNVGMFGTSYGGFNSLQVAMHRPPALKAICPMYFTDNRYTDDCHYKGGAMQMLYDVGTYGLGMVLMNALPPYPQGAGERWGAVWEEHLQNEPWLLRWVENQTYTEQWKQGSLCEDYGAIQCATFLIGGWRDGYTNCNLRTFQNLQCPKKVLIGPWLHVMPDTGVPGPRVDHAHEMARFWDYWLKGVENGVMDEPPVTIYVQQYDPPRADRSLTSGFWRHEPGWPLKRTTEHTLYLARNATLGAQAPAEADSTEYSYNPTVGATFGIFSAGGPHVLPADQRLEDAYSLNWTSEPLREPLEILGHPEAVLHVSVTTDIATVAVRLIDVAPDGQAALVTKGVLNLTHRDSHETPSPVAPGEIYEVRVALDATSWLFEPGHRIRVAIAGADFPNAWPSPNHYTGRVYTGADRRSHLMLPALGPQQPALPTPRLRPPASIDSPFSGVGDRPVWRITRDTLQGTCEVTIRGSGTSRSEDVKVTRSSEARAIVSEREPGRASVRGAQQVTLHWPDRAIEARARGQIESTEIAFHVTIQLEITMDGAPHFSKRWVRSVPRQLL